MDWNDIDRLRAPGFTVARRGYDQREVDRLLGSLVDWLETDAAKQIADLAIKRKLEFVGKSTARILVSAEEESVKLRELADQECVELRSQAEAASLEKRQAADQHAKKARATADDEARRTEEAARAKATQTVEEGERRRAEIETTVRKLERQRDETIHELERLRGQLASTLGTHQPEAPAPKAGASKPAKQPQKAKEPDAVAKA